jgi:hypothetical protein
MLLALIVSKLTRRPATRPGPDPDLAMALRRLERLEQSTLHHARTIASGECQIPASVDGAKSFID